MNSEIKSRDDAMRKTVRHTKRVAELLASVIYNFSKRAALHDESKFSEEEWPSFANATHRLKNLNYGTDGYKAALNEIRPAIDHHQSNNTHHPEYYSNGVQGMSLFDLLEMLVDWKAAGERHDDGDIWKSLEHNKKRFGISDSLAEILTNTIKELEQMEGWDK